MCKEGTTSKISRVETEGGKSCVNELTGGRGVIGDAVRERGIQHRAKDAKLLRGESKRHRQGRECEHEIEKVRKPSDYGESSSTTLRFDFKQTVPSEEI